MAVPLSFGERFRMIREAKKAQPSQEKRFTQEAVSERLKHQRAATISMIEGKKGDGVPQAKTIAQYAHALECLPQDLLVGVVTQHDKLRYQDESGAFDELMYRLMLMWPHAAERAKRAAVSQLEHSVDEPVHAQLVRDFLEPQTEHGVRAETTPRRMQAIPGDARRRKR